VMGCFRMGFPQRFLRMWQVWYKVMDN
jgi:hypothetical protein